MRIVDCKQVNDVDAINNGKRERERKKMSTELKLKNEQ